MKKIFFVLGLFLFFISSYIFIYSSVGKNKNYYLKSLISGKYKKIIKDTFFKYKILSNEELKFFQDQIYELSLYKEFYFKEDLINIKVIKTKEIKLSENKTLEKYKIVNGFYSTINSTEKNAYPVGYLDFHNENIFILSSRGILAYKEKLKNKEDFTQVKNNIDKFIGIKQFKKRPYFSLRDLYIHQGKIFISYVEEIKKDCWNTSMIYGDINYKDIVFKKLFSAKDCVSSKDNIDNEFAGTQSGARIFNFDENHYLLTIGDYRSRYLAQKKNSVNGKIIKINIHNKNFEIISMGHRNPQGLYFDKDKNFILETEHGPRGGDEINIIEIDEVSKDEILNYGWPIVSAGEHYDKTEEKYEKYPLHKSHTKFGFIEPIKSFVPSIGISQIIKIKKNKYVVSSMKDKSLYFFELDNEKKIKNLNRIEVFERVRDLNVKNNKLYLFLEGSASIGVIDLN